MTFARAQRGFTLIEMLAGTALLAITLSVLLPVIGLSTKSLSQSEIRSRMAVVARSLIDEVTLTGLRLGQTDGIRDGFEWHLECQNQDTGTGITLLVLNLTLHGDTRTEQFSTVRFQSLNQRLAP